MTVANARLVVLRMGQTERVSKLVDRNTLEIDRASYGICLGIVDSKAKSIADFRVELDVVIKNRSRFVSARGKLVIAVVINISHYGNRARNIRVSVAIDIIAIRQSGVLNQIYGWRRSDGAKVRRRAER